MNYKKIGVSVLGLAIATTLLTGCCNQCGQHTMEAGVTPVAASGQIMEDFTLQDIDGKIHHLSDYKGKKVYIKFWASWCSICVKTLAETDRLAADMDKDFVVLSVVAPNVGGEMSKDKFIEWFKGQGYTSLPVLLDEGGKVTKQYGIYAYPTGVLIDTEGKVQSIILGHLPKEVLQKEMSKLS